MFPTHAQIPGKRKAEESNPLLNAAASAKRAKKDVRASPFLCFDGIADLEALMRYVGCKIGWIDETKAYVFANAYLIRS